MRLIIDSPLRGSLNMAIDKALLESAAEEGVATLRIYGWQPATISLGYFQASGHRQTHEASLDCPVVRRASGGGAIVHDRELTYSIAVPSTDRWAKESRELFDLVHRSLIECLEGFGVSGCQVYDQAKKESKSAPFLCFQRRANGDVVIGEDKVIGSAQRRLKSAILQHGSVLVEMSACAPELPGIVNLSESTDLTIEKLTQIWPKQLGERMGWQLNKGNLTSQELATAEAIEREVFGNSNWNLKR